MRLVHPESGSAIWKSDKQFGASIPPIIQPTNEHLNLIRTYVPSTMSAEQSPPHSGVTGESLSTALKDRLEATFVDIKDLSGES
jgi:hypothetical protein